MRANPMHVMKKLILSISIIFLFDAPGLSLNGGNPPPRAFDYAPLEHPDGMQRDFRNDSIDYAIESMMEYGHVPGLAACIVKGNNLLWAKGYGFANIATQTPSGIPALFMLASVSKVVTGTALMQLYEDGLFALGDDINAYLPFSVRNPLYPNTPVTFHMLLTHTSSINDNWGIMPYYAGDSPIPLGEYLEDYLSPSGGLYDPINNFNTWPPGTTWEYCNIAIALAGYLVETVSGIAFDDYCHQEIFTPLGMSETAWHLADLDIAHIAMPYSYNGLTYVPYGHFGYSDYPAGQLRTSVGQLGRFLSACINGGEYLGQRILETSTIDMMLTLQVPGSSSIQGIVWRKDGTKWGHGGGDLGVNTMMVFEPATGIGVIVLTNGENGNVTDAVVNLLFDYADDLTVDGIPTLSQWGILAFVLLLLAGGIYMVRKKRCQEPFFQKGS